MAYSVERIGGVDSYKAEAMRSLEHMVIDHCQNQERIPKGLKDFTYLRKFKTIGLPVQFEHRPQFIVFCVKSSAI